MTLYVNGEKIDENEIQQEVERLRPHYMEIVSGGQASEEQEKQLYEWSRDNIIEVVLLRQAAARDGEPVPPEDIESAYQGLTAQRGGTEPSGESPALSEEQQADIRAAIDRRLRLERLLDRLHREAPPPSDEDVRKHYEENLENYSAPEMVRVSHIVKHFEPGADPAELQAEMQKILKKLRNNNDFGEMAAEHSDCPDSQGDLGFFPRGQMVQEFEDVVFALTVGQVSGIFETEFGYHVAKVTDKRPPRPYPLEQVRQSIVEELTGQRSQKAVEDFVDAERAKAVIEEREG